MSAHDDYFDLAAAFKEYERAYELWGQSVDGSREDDWKRAPVAIQNRRAKRLSRALRGLHLAAIYALDGHEKRGWPKLLSRDDWKDRRFGPGEEE